MNRHLSVKHGIFISELHHYTQILYDRLLHQPVNLFYCIIMSADVPVIVGSLHQLIIIFPCQKPHIVNLRNPRCKKLNCPGQKIAVIPLPHRRIVGAVNLIHHLFAAIAAAVIPFKISPILFSLTDHGLKLLRGE